MGTYLYYGAFNIILIFNKAPKKKNRFGSEDVSDFMVLIPYEDIYLVLRVPEHTNLALVERSVYEEVLHPTLISNNII
jgi:hypothetical protein